MSSCRQTDALDDKHHDHEAEGDADDDAGLIIGAGAEVHAVIDSKKQSVGRSREVHEVLDHQQIGQDIDEKGREMRQNRAEAVIEDVLVKNETLGQAFGTRYRYVHLTLLLRNGSARDARDIHRRIYRDQHGGQKKGVPFFRREKADKGQRADDIPLDKQQNQKIRQRLEKPGRPIAEKVPLRPRQLVVHNSLQYAESEAQHERRDDDGQALGHGHQHDRHDRKIVTIVAKASLFEQSGKKTFDIVPVLYPTKDIVDVDLVFIIMNIEVAREQYDEDNHQHRKETDD